MWFSIGAHHEIVKRKDLEGGVGWPVRVGEWLNWRSALEGGPYEGKKRVEGGGARIEGEEIGEVVGEARFCLVERDSAGEEFFERGGLAIGDAAGNDKIEVAEVGGDVVSEAVRGDPAADVNADGGEFLFAGAVLHPDAGFAGNAIGGHTEIGAGADHGLFEGANIPADVAFDVAEVKDGIADDLAGAVIGDVSAAIGGVEFDALLTEDVFGGEEIGAAGIAAESDDVRMFAEEKDVVDGGGFAGGDEALLQGVGVGIGD
jgi:hypothetical protein